MVLERAGHTVMEQPGGEIDTDVAAHNTFVVGAAAGVVHICYAVDHAL